MNALILGASGLVGGNCLNQFSLNKANTVLGTYFSFKTDNTQYFDTLNLDNPKNVDLNDFKPDVIVHCGALTHVDYCEDHVEESFQKTVQSTINAVEICKKYNAKLVYLSTDYVFDGKKGFCVETDEVNPLSVYGQHKLDAEKHVQENLENHLIVRITNVYGNEIRGKNFVLRLSENMQKDKTMNLRLPFDQYATPANAADIARAIEVLLENNKTGIYHFGSTDYLNRPQLAQKVYNYFGHNKVTIIPISTASMNQAANRPLLGGFSVAKFISEFPDFEFTSVDDFLIELADGVSE